MQNQSKQRAGLFKLIPVRKSFAGTTASSKREGNQSEKLNHEEVFQYNIWVTTKYSLGSFILFLQSGLQRLLILSEVIKPLPDQKVINKLKCRVPPCDFRQLSRFSIKRTLGCLRNSRIHLRASRPGKGLPSKIDRNSWCSCYITFVVLGLFSFLSQNEIRSDFTPLECDTDASEVNLCLSCPGGVVKRTAKCFLRQK